MNDTPGPGTLADLKACPIRAPSAAAAKSVAADLKPLAQDHPEIAAVLGCDSPAREFLLAALALSPFLRETVMADPRSLALALSRPCAQVLAHTITAARDCWRGADGTLTSEADLMQGLRRAKRRVSLTLALNDLSRQIDARHTTVGLSDLADATLGAAFDHLLRAGHDAGKLTLPDPDNPCDKSGLIVLGMGKHGARELNYSSDIDIVVFFDPEAGIVKDSDEATDVFARMVRRLVRIMQERTGDGYVFRTDLRLRPDPGSTPLAFPLDAAMNYYESRGQNWERAAFIKARPVAGDLDAGERFLKELVPFVFRKYLDFAAISDIHSIKRQIHAHRGFGDIAVKGHNVKLGRGGIREIEFFVQTQQLIAGGRMPRLRMRRTDEMLVALARARWIDPATARTLAESYWYLRDVEHRIQMVRDEQSHTLPESEAELARVALMMGEASTASFGKAYVAVLTKVEQCYAELFEKEAGLSGGMGNLVFTGEDDDPGTLKTLAELGFERPADISRIIRTWHYGRYRATQSVEARERLTELTPELLRVFGATKRADEALIRFDAFISGLPAGIQLFSLIGTNPGLLSLMVTIMASAPRLAEIIARKPHVFDGMLDPGLMAELPTRDYLAERLQGFLEGARAYEEILDRLRIVALEQKFLIGVRLLTGAISPERAARSFSHLADLIIGAALEAVREGMEEAHGTVPGGRAAVIGMGKLGSYELTAGSDIDIILLYDHDPDAEESDGPKPLDPVRYYTRMTQRLVAALSAPTAEGILYEVDLRLRPSGNKGPVATSIRAFSKYQSEEAWTWEHMALTRARVVAGEDSLREEARTLIDEVLAKPRDEARLLEDLVEMRGLIEQEKPPRDIWDVKLIPGGLIDIEFIAQYLSLKARAGGWLPAREDDEAAGLLAGPEAAPAQPKPVYGECTSTDATLKILGPGELGEEVTEELRRALALWSGHAQVVRLCTEGGFDPKQAPAGLIDLLTRTGQAPDLASLEADFKTTSKRVRAIFRKVTG
ncbi:MAG: bifunctional [glutamine synthetase] adenylyltransferase/[glutamine synthetase]-adenylyl-L-tyrosine phosphorylase [Hoeflea sp.]|uniref:bifunctional [glutamine synthetase] adenylyltransferase/[glutamine synthetase]-adenylyl-L-tyrosine phosphorylase n=1 Tax=Hoeflea sp. TaxID=1940281 RepID=UPI001DA5363A|nr:bifunctional [glutamine synthetase] adenylyltransferase/[glutamine synthetase]-adenylyl-L-tyrosine phosphorylase [Hoeflea sp.]MBU4530147.1 bifunctional [glutamine synthetase] adenylyltransferase/[glutamine synthetase]-adenylyl-L-tyrosine phosphorylase [Alphaproteobacteria bacterium]MBU4542568.1 bifunctional [glutamine synthetase] adenylyltransferase/[glutamine synthetase]-adenylyl-L-tyrosine phosphorylase [Alphaproteobacteria bacterium]MBU4551249.1 bifunctional [glutamine synthetase] adenylyl